MGPDIYFLQRCQNPKFAQEQYKLNDSDDDNHIIRFAKPDWIDEPDTEEFFNKFKDYIIKETIYNPLYDIEEEIEVLYFQVIDYQKAGINLPKPSNRTFILNKNDFEYYRKYTEPGYPMLKWEPDFNKHIIHFEH